MWFFLLACKQESKIDYGPRGDCNPLSEVHCLLPFPSDFYLEDDTRTPTGKKIALTTGSLPVNIDDVPIEPTYLNENDGFSIGS